MQRLGERFCGGVIGSVLDNAPAHRWQDARIPENVLLVPLPPYGPELNPVERLFLELRRELANQLFDSIDAIQLAATGFLERYYLVCYPFRAPECIKLNAAIFRFTLVLSDLNVFT